MRDTPHRHYMMNGPSAGIVNPWELCYALAETAVRNGAELHLSTPVAAIEREGGLWRLTTPKGEFAAPYVLNCAGVAADRIAAMAGDESFRIQPTKGEYFLLDKSEGHRVEHVIFQCPSELGKGVLALWLLMVGLWLVLQHKPRSETVLPPSSVTLPLPVAELAVILVTESVVITVGKLANVVKLTSFPYAVPLMLVA